MSNKNDGKAVNRYVVLLAGMIIQLCAGIIYMWSVFKGPIIAHLSWNVNSASMVTSVMMIIFVIGLIIGGRAADMYGAKKTSIIGTLLMAAGIFATAFVPSAFPELLFVTYAVIGGFGVGIVYISTVAVIQKWFFDKRGFATGMLVGAFGFSLVIFTPIAKMMLKDMGVPTTFMIFGAVFLVICLLCSLLLATPPADYTVNKGGVKVNVLGSQKQYPPKEMIRTKQFYLLFFALFFVVAGYFTLNPNLMELGTAHGVADASIGVMLIGLFGAVGRVVITWVSDKIGRTPALMLIPILSAAGIALAIFGQGYVFLIAISVVAFAYGGVSGTFAIATGDNFGTKNGGVNFGIVSLAMGFGSLAFMMLATAMRTGTDYTVPFIIDAAACVVSIALLVILLRMKKDQATA